MSKFGQFFITDFDSFRRETSGATRSPPSCGCLFRQGAPSEGGPSGGHMGWRFLGVSRPVLSIKPIIIYVRSSFSAHTPPSGRLIEKKVEFVSLPISTTILTRKTSGATRRPPSGGWLLRQKAAKKVEIWSNFLYCGFRLLMT
uniref:Uncharacterized protein n=1 Tax=Cacopsylla melanoneura TaxID=428564 RepID=A0A8D8XMP2_9HEMI